MSEEQSKLPLFKTASVAANINNDENSKHIHRSDLNIVSDNQSSETTNNSNNEAVNTSNEISVVLTTTNNEPDDERNSQHVESDCTSLKIQLNFDHLVAKKNKSSSGTTNNKSTSSNNQKKKQHGPNAKTLQMIRDAQKARIEDERKAAEVKEQQRLEELDRAKQEILRKKEEEEDREKLKQLKNKDVQLKQKSLYITKKSRQKLQHARIQLDSIGIEIPAHDSIHQSKNSQNSEIVKKRIMYDDSSYLLKRLSPSKTVVQCLPTSTILQENDLEVEDTDKTTNEWIDYFERENMSNEKLQNLSKTEVKQLNGNDQLQLNINSMIQKNSSEIKSTNTIDNEHEKCVSSMESVRHRLDCYHELCESQRSLENLRAPIICVLGHVDAGKTTMLDNLRQTHVQDNEAGGITQQIGATNVPLETLYRRTQMYRNMISCKSDFIVPGLLIIDTPGHETFKNLRLRGSSLCDLAILVVDIMNGLAPQTIESIQLLTERKTPFIIALNKVDQLYAWKSNVKNSIDLVLEEQQQITKNHFEKRCNEIICEFAQQHLNVALYYKNPDPNEYYSLVPTSARTGDGMGSLIALIIEKSQTTLLKRLSYTDELQATVIEVKKIDGIGTTIDIALVNGCLSVGDKIVVAGQEGPIVTQIRCLLIPKSNQEMRITNQYQNQETVKGAQGIKILAKDLDQAMAGLPLFIARHADEVDFFKNEIETMLKSVLNAIEIKEKGVYVQASTLGSLEALLQLLKESKIPYSGINIGPVHRKDVIRASVQLNKDPLMATILAFDVNIERDAQLYANQICVKILQNDEIYHLRDMFITYKEDKNKQNQEQYAHLAVFPCKLKILPQYIFNARDPIICGVMVKDGFIKKNTPICIPSKNGIDLGRISSIEKNGHPLEIARKGSEVCIKIESIQGQVPKAYGRHFDKDDILISKISRESINILKDYFREEMQTTDWKLIIELKEIFNIN